MRWIFDIHDFQITGNINKNNIYIIIDKYKQFFKKFLNYFNFINWFNLSIILILISPNNFSIDELNSCVTSTL